MYVCICSACHDFQFDLFRKWFSVFFLFLLLQLCFFSLATILRCWLLKPLLYIFFLSKSLAFACLSCRKNRSNSCIAICSIFMYIHMYSHMCICICICMCIYVPANHKVLQGAVAWRGVSHISVRRGCFSNLDSCIHMYIHIYKQTNSDSYWLLQHPHTHTYVYIHAQYLRKHLLLILTKIIKLFFFIFVLNISFLRQKS